jgi:hypothetical protein
MQLPRGLFDVGINPLDSSGQPTTLISGFKPQSLSATYQSDTFNISGGDVLLEQGEDNERIELSLQTAGLPLDAIAALEGTTVTTTGTGSTLKSVLTKNLNTDERPYVQVIAQQKDKEGGDTTYLFPKAFATGSPTLNPAQGQYLTPTIPLTAVSATDAVTGPPAVAVGDFYIITQNATFAALS